MFLLKNFLKQDEGVTAIEYVLIAIFIALAIIIGVGLVGVSLNTLFTTSSVKYILK